ncbi:MAG: DUF3299 domain-containing protein [Gammaproteobacteria bacterium]|nr:DUF3299 domain-containing protein [Gammaproteobacteria bacterium]
MKKTIYFLSITLFTTYCSFILANDVRILEWDEMMPDGYVESLLSYNENNFSASDSFSFDDSTEEAQNAYDKLRETLASAPIVPELNNQLVKIAGFIVPLDFDFDTETFKEFLLVPYFGACIHTPPPPSNQIVYVSSKTRLDQEWLDYAVWASGILSTKSKDSLQGYAAYSMDDVNLEEYKDEE